MKNYLFLVLSLFFSHCTTVIQGEFQSKGKSVIDFQFTPTRCYSGERLQFHGVILLDQNPNGIRITGIEDQSLGKSIKIRIPSLCQTEDDCEEIFLSKKVCSKYKFQIQPTNVRINSIRAIKGNLELECNLPNGSILSGKSNFEYCY